MGAQTINNVVIVSGEQRRDSAMRHIDISILPQTPLPPRLPHNPEQRSTCYMAGPCLLTILNIGCTWPSQTSQLSCPPGNPSSFSKSASPFLFCNSVHLCHFFLDPTHKGCHTIFLLLWLHSVWQPLCSVLIQGQNFRKDSKENDGFQCASLEKVTLRKRWPKRRDEPRHTCVCLWGMSFLSMSSGSPLYLLMLFPNGF